MKNFLYILLIFSFTNIYSQENKNYIVIDKTSSEYVVFVNGILNGSDSIQEKKYFFITSRDNYNKHIETKEPLDYPDGEPLNLNGFRFRTILKSEISSCEFKKLTTVDYSWLTKNERIKTSKYIELNNFKNLCLVLKNRNNYLVFEIIREFTSH